MYMCVETERERVIDRDRESQCECTCECVGGMNASASLATCMQLSKVNSGYFASATNKN